MIRVIIERQIAQEMERTYEEHARQALKNAIEIPGFVSGESLKDERDPNHRVILSSWRSAADWYRWQGSPERREMMARIRLCWRPTNASWSWITPCLPGICDARFNKTGDFLPVVIEMARPDPAGVPCTSELLLELVPVLFPAPSVFHGQLEVENGVAEGVGLDPVSDQLHDATGTIHNIADQPVDPLAWTPAERILAPMGDLPCLHQPLIHGPVIHGIHMHPAPHQLPGPATGRGTQIHGALSGRQQSFPSVTRDKHLPCFVELKR